MDDSNSSMRGRRGAEAGFKGVRVTVDAQELVIRQCGFIFLLGSASGKSSLNRSSVGDYFSS